MRFRGFHAQNRTGPAGHLLSVWRGESSQELCLPGEKISQPFFPKYFHFSMLSLGSNLIIQTEESHIINGIKSHIKVIWFFREL